jgi:Ca2+-binding EF-hand superfamily protein
MKTYAFVFSGVAAMLLSSVPASAQQAENKRSDLPGPIHNLQDLQDSAKMVFKLADENNDGQISLKEAQDAANLVAGGFFFRADKNGDGVLSADEAKSAREAFLNTKPWIKYAVETARANGPKNAAAAGETNRANGNNFLATLEATFDTNGDKQLQASELRQAVQTTVAAAFSQADTNRDGQLSPAELNAAAAGATRQAGEMAFKEADTDNNGQISQAEFEKAILKPARVAFEIMDLNHDGQLSPQEAQTARQVVMSQLKALNVREPSTSPRNENNRALGNQTQPSTPTPPPSR